MNSSEPFLRRVSDLRLSMAQHRDPPGGKMDPACCQIPVPEPVVFSARGQIVSIHVDALPPCRILTADRGWCSVTFRQIRWLYRLRRHTCALTQLFGRNVGKISDLRRSRKPGRAVWARDRPHPAGAGRKSRSRPPDETRYKPERTQQPRHWFRVRIRRWQKRRARLNGGTVSAVQENGVVSTISGSIRSRPAAGTYWRHRSMLFVGCGRAGQRFRLCGRLRVLRRLQPALFRPVPGGALPVRAGVLRPFPLRSACP